MLQPVHQQSLYEVLSLKKDCSTEDVHRAYRKRARFLHPDKAGEANSAAFLRLGLARDVLSNERLRKHYDLYGESKLPQSCDEIRWMEYGQIGKEITLRFVLFASGMSLRLAAVVTVALCSLIKLYFYAHIDAMLESSTICVPSVDRVNQSEYYSYFINPSATEEIVRIPRFSLFYDSDNAFTTECFDPETGVVFYIRPFLSRLLINEDLLRFVRKRYSAIKSKARGRILTQRKRIDEQSSLNRSE